MSQPGDLERFVIAQQAVYPAVLDELRRGKKSTHWMWFVFPQVDGLGHSAMARRFAIQSRDEGLAAATTPRSLEPPTATGLPRKSGWSLFDGRIESVHIDMNDLANASC
jgi:hypothetical protein